MADIFVEHSFDPGVTERDVHAGAHAARDSLELHRVRWQESFLGIDGRRILCRLRAPDAESARAALRYAGMRVSAVWPGTILETREPLAANVLVQRSFRAPVTVEEIPALEMPGAWCRATHRLRLTHALMSFDGKRMIGFYHAPDAESVRLAHRQGGMPLDAAWAFRRVAPR